MGFIFEKEILNSFKKDSNFEEIILPNFFPWNYGPFSKDLLIDLEFLINQDYIQINMSTAAPLKVELEEYQYWVDDLDDFRAREYDQEVFSLTSEKGIPKVLEIWDNLTNNQKNIMSEFKNKFNTVPLNAILDYVYKKYKIEGYTDKSLIKNRFLN